MRISDWSSDVCSSDLAVLGGQRVLDLRHLRDQALRDLAYLARDLRVRVDRALLRQDLLVGLQAQRLLVLRRYGLVDQPRRAGQRIGRAGGEMVVGAVGDERHQDQQPRAEGEPERESTRTKP